MKFISSLGINNQNPIYDKEGPQEQQNNYQPSYLNGAKTNEDDLVTFTGNKKESVKAKGIKGLLIALAATMGLSSGCAPVNTNNMDTSSVPASSVVQNVDETHGKSQPGDTKKVELLDLESNIPVVSVVSTVMNDGENVEVKKFPNILAMMDDKFPNEEQVNSTTHVVRTSSNEADECTTLLEAINKQYTEPFVNNGGDPGEITGAVLDQIARELIEGNEDMQKAIAEYYGVENWQEADIEAVLNDDLYEMGIMEFQTPDTVEIHGISTISPLYNRSESATTLYTTQNDTIKLDNSIKTVEDLYAAFASNYADNSGKEASTSAASIAAWLTIKDNQYNEAFDGKINNDGDRTDLMLLQTLSELEDGETLELNLPQTFGLNVTASGKSIEDVSIDDAYHIVHEMTPSESSFTLDGSKVVASEEETPGIYDFVDIATLYSDPDTLEPYATKTLDENGNYVFQYNLDVADLNAKTYSLYEQFAYDHMDFFAATQTIDVDGEEKEYQFGVFDVEEGYEDVVSDLIKNGDYDGAKQYLTFNLDRFINGSFYNEDGTLKTDGDLTMSLEQYFYVNDGEGSTVAKPAPEKPNDEPSDSDVEPTPVPDTDSEPTPVPDTDTDSIPDTDTDSIPDTDTDSIPDTDTDSIPDTDTDSIPDTDTDSIPDTDTDSIPDTDTDSIPDTDTDSIPDTDTDSIPDTDTDSIPDTDTDSIPDTDTDSIPDTDTDSIPDTDTDSIPDTDTDSIPDTDTDSIPDTDTDTDTDSVPDSDTDSPNPDPPVDTDTDSIPDTDTDSIPDTDTDSIPDTDTDSIPDTDTDSIPDTDTDSIPDTDTDSIPDTDTDTDTDSVPDSDTDSPNPDPPVDTDTDSIPDTDTDSIPDTDTDSMPDTDTDSIPDTDTDSIPDTDTDSIPDTDTDSIPDTDTDTDTDSVPDSDTDSPNPDPPVDTDTDSIPDTDTDSIPDTDTDSIPDTDTDSIPDTDTDSMPDTDTDSIPDTDTDSIPDTDTDSIPDTDTDSIPDTDTDSIPDTDTDSIPDTDTDSIPDTDTDSIPDTDTDSIPDTDTDSIPDTDTDSIPDTDTDSVPDSEGEEDCPPEDEVIPDMDGGLTEDTTTPDSGNTGETTPDSGNTGETTPDSGNTGETTPDSGNTGETTPDSGNTGETTPDVPCEDEDAVAPEQTVVVTPEQTPAEQAPAQETAPAEQTPAEQAPAQETAPAEQTPAQDQAPEQQQDEAPAQVVETYSEPVQESAPEPEPEPVQESTPEPEPVQESAPEPEPVQESAPEPEPVQESAPEPEPEPVQESAPEPEPVQESTPAPEPEPVQESAPEPAPAPAETNNEVSGEDYSDLDW